MWFRLSPGYFRKDPCVTHGDITFYEGQSLASALTDHDRARGAFDVVPEELLTDEIRDPRVTARTATARIAEEAVIVVLSGHGPNLLWRLCPRADVISSEADVTREGDVRDFVEQSCSRLSSQLGWGFAPHACTIRGRPLSVVGSAASAYSSATTCATSSAVATPSATTASAIRSRVSGERSLTSPSRPHR